MSTAALVPVETYLRLTEKPYREYRDGVLYPKAMPTKYHSIIQRVLMALLQSQGVPSFPELTLRISPTKYLIPGVTVADDFLGPYPRKPSRSAAKYSPRRTAWGRCSPSARNITRGACRSVG